MFSKFFYVEETRDYVKMLLEGLWDTETGG